MSSVLVIGAGPAGLATGYALHRAGVDYEIVDKSDHVGSTWSNLYPSLKLNTAGLISHMPDLRIPLRYGLLPSGRQYYAHLLEWSRRHPLNIRLNTQVRRVGRGAQGWCVETTRGEREYRVVVLASGRFCQPYIPDIPGRENFRGRVLHASEFHDPYDFSGQRILVVGSGPSGADIALALTPVAALPVWMAIRSDIVIARRNPYGLNETLWKLLIHRLPAAWQKPVSDRLLYQSYPGLRSLRLPLAPNRDDRVGTSVPIRGPEFVRAVRHGTVRTVRGMAAFTPEGARLDDGTEVACDVIVMATGYRPALGYLDIPYEADAQGWPMVVTPESTQVRDAPGLFLVGRYYRGLGALNNIRGESRKAAEEILTYLQSVDVPRAP